VTKCYSYLRWSTPEQKLGDSERRQIDAAERYAAQHGYEMDHDSRLVDDGISAFRGANAGADAALGKFLIAVQAGDIPTGSVLLVEGLDRVSRQDPSEAIFLFQSIVRAGVTLVTLASGRVFDRASLKADPFRWIEAIVIMIRANEESETKSRRIKAAWKARRSSAAKTGKLMTEFKPGWMEIVDGRWVLVPEKAEAIRMMVKMFLAGAGQATIARKLNADGVTPFGGGKMWDASAVRHVLSKPAIAGICAPREEDAEGKRGKRLEAIEGYFPAVIDRDTWTDLQTLTAGRQQPFHRVAKEAQNPLAGLATCCLCGSALTRVVKDKRYSARLVCRAAKAGAGCGYHSLKLDDIVDALKRALPIILAEAPSGNDEIDREIAELRSQLEGTEDQLGRLVDAIRDHGHSTTLSESLTALEHSKRATEAQLQDALGRAAVASPVATERRRAELLEAIQGQGPNDTGASGLRPLDAERHCAAGELGLKLRGVFASVVPDHRTGLVALTWVGGAACGREVMFAWPKGET
jgi:DNA invertase Pin-like site-specific DNA recombinase